MNSGAEVLELRQSNQEPNEVDSEWLADKENEIWKRLYRKKEELWEIGRLLFEVNERYAYKKGYMKWLSKFRRELPYRTAYDYIRIYRGCPTKEHVQYFPLKFLRKMCKATFNKKLRQFLFDNRGRFNEGLTDDEFDQIVEKLTGEDFDPQDPELQRLLKNRDENLDELHKINRNEDELKKKQSKYDEWLTFARPGLVPHSKDGKVRIRRKFYEKEVSVVVRELERLELMPDYELID